jgi:DNA-binding NarL/FixJ family response regulator
MEDNLRILVVDDHQLMADGIVGALSQISDLYDIASFNSCDDAFEHLSQQAENNPFHILFTDLSFENTDEDTLIDGGESLIRKVREAGIPLKIGVITGHTETNRVFNVISNLNPDAYILKNQCTKDELSFAIQQMKRDIPFYSHEIHQKILKRNVIQIQMDDVAIQILKQLPKQSKIINLEGMIKKADGKYMKIRAIENKLANLRIDLNANNNTDLVLKAKELGIID